MRPPEDRSALFRARGMKVTPQRQCIFHVLHGNQTHPSAEAVYAAAATEIPTLSLKTVYQTLNDLAAMGEIAVLDLGTGASRFDPDIEVRHHHLVCDGCGKVRDLRVDFGPLEVPDAELGGFALGSTEIVLRGRCGECRCAGARL